MEAGLVVSRLLHYLACLALFGLALFPFYSFPHAAPAALLRRCRFAIAVAAVAAIISAALWFLFSAATMAGTLDGAMDPATLSSVAHDTSFGRLWLWRLGLGACLALLCLGRLLKPPKQTTDWIVLPAAAVLLATIGGTGHTQTHEGATRLIHMLSDGAHLLAAGTWIGGLIGLAILVAPSLRSAPAEAHRVLARFSGIGSLAVATLVATGLVNSWLLVGSVGSLFTTSYGLQLIAKLCAFLGMVALAGLNRFWLVPALAGGPADRVAGTLARLRCHIYAEQALGAAVIMAVAVLGTMEPAITPA